ncbi:DnaB-like helicase C-terminal domain-containing protein [Paenibacillus qinlingensis]|uniref:DnaB-like helicase C-terminal domain-containing protein n=1 Tax=Paenibacillus qinlingensis TaxID=1837343 RepID=UPI0015662537|nr:DnaB-like helicase C-terminal domain-containing protein [Paenibacillus qinlingensis]NQX62167.1 hypothetical protein [Paenibacillus qinlingensis]
MKREKIEVGILKGLCANLRLWKTLLQNNITELDFTDPVRQSVFRICSIMKLNGKLTTEMVQRLAVNESDANNIVTTYIANQAPEHEENFKLFVIDLTKIKRQQQHEALKREYIGKRNKATDKESVDLEFARKLLAIKDTNILFENTSAEEIIAEHYKQEKRKQAIPTFLKELDQHCKFYRGEPNVIAAGSGVGKTTTMVNCAAKAAEAGYKVLILTQEMDALNLVFKALAIISGKEEAYWRLENRLDDAPENFVLTKENAIQLLSHFFNGRLVLENQILSAEKLCHRLEYAEEQGFDLVFYDYFQLCKAEKPKANGDYERYAEVSDMIRQCVKGKGLAFVWLSQITADLHDPGNSKLKNTSKLKDDAASVLIMYKKKSDPLLPGIHPNLYCYINKNRYGIKDLELPFPFDYKRQRIGSYSFSDINERARSRILAPTALDLFDKRIKIGLPIFDENMNVVPPFKSTGSEEYHAFAISPKAGESIEVYIP